MCRKPKPSQRGFTLLEILLALAVVAILSFVIFRAFNSANNSAQVSSAAADVGTIEANMATTFMDNYTGMSTSIANEAHVFPTDMNNDNFSGAAPITDPWGGAVAIWQWQATIRNHYVLSYTGVPSAVCPSFVEQAAQNAMYVVVGPIGATGTYVMAPNGLASPTIIASACNLTSHLQVQIVSN